MRKPTKRSGKFRLETERYFQDVNQVRAQPNIGVRFDLFARQSNHYLDQTATMPTKPVPI